MSMYKINDVRSIFMYLYEAFMKKLKSMVLTDSLKTEDGYVSNVDQSYLIGKKCISLTSLNPVGYANIDGERIEVTSGGSFINKDVNLIVIDVVDFRVLVSKYKN